MFLTSTACFNHKTGEPEAIILIISCRFEGAKYKFLFGMDGQHYQQVSALSGGDPVFIERINGNILVNRMPVKRFYTRRINGLVELAGNSWKKLTRKPLNSVNKL